jgi:hypothetical protein
VRIELGEIESLLRAQPGVWDVAVDVRGEKANQMLAAYVVWEEDWPEKNLAVLQPFRSKPRMRRVGSDGKALRKKAGDVETPAPPRRPHNLSSCTSLRQGETRPETGST